MRRGFDGPTRRRTRARYWRRSCGPVLLRRTKGEVATELPERIEERRDCELTKGQRRLYLAELRRSRQLVEELGGTPQQPSAERITILAALTRLRQICCHPALAGGSTHLGSGKFDAFFELIEPLLAEGHKVLVFSQFVELPEAVERRAAPARGIAHRMLTGQTQAKRRTQLVQAFQDDPDPGVFLISLKAGGTGLNLTSASYVSCSIRGGTRRSRRRRSTARIASGRIAP